MADENHTLRSIDWRSVLPFTHLFRSFRIAIHPSKLGLALLAILIVYGAGRLLDWAWPGEHRAVPGEISQIYESSFATGGKVSFSDLRNAAKTQNARIYEAERRELMEYRRNAGELVADETAFDDDAAHAVIEQRLEAAVAAARKAYDELPEPTHADRDVRDEKIRAAYAQAAESAAKLKSIKLRGPFATFIDYECAAVDQIALAILRFDWIGDRGVLSGIYRGVVVGPTWAFSKHPVYFTLLLLLALPVWAVFGGAIARIAAVHVARDEVIGIRQALRFSIQKLLSFLTAPLIPLILVGFFALIFAIGGWISEIQFLRIGAIWSIAVAVGFVIVIGVAVLMASTLFGTITGFGLMYPTIAVEGSDSLDAISRSFSSVFARPWKVLFYTLVSLVYASLTYLFLRFMVFVTLSVAYVLITAFTSDTGPDGTTSLANVWHGPASLYELTQGVDSMPLTTAETIAAGFISFWVYLFVSLLGAYLISLYISSNTIIYYLIRQDVDLTDMEDVYLEPIEPGEDELDDDEIDEPENGDDKPANDPRPAEPKSEQPKPDDKPPESSNETPPSDENKQ